MMDVLKIFVMFDIEVLFGERVVPFVAKNGLWKKC